MNILVFNLTCATPLHGPSYRPHFLAEEWARTGHNVTFVGTTFSHQLTKPPTERGGSIRTSHNGVNYFLLRTPQYKGSGGARGVNVLAGLAQGYLQQGKFTASFKPQLVLATTVYQVDNYPAANVARKFGAAFFRETRDLWPLTLLEIGGMKRSHPFVRLVQWAEDYGYRHADRVCTTLEDSFEYMGTRGLARDRWAYLPQCPESAPPKPAPVPPMHKLAFDEARAAGKFIAVFAGGFNPYADLATVARAAKRLGPGVQFMLIGHGPVRPQLDALIASEQIGNVRLLDPVPKGALPEIFGWCDVGLVGFSKAPIFNYGISPNKLFDYLAHRLPAILYCDSRRNPISESGGGLQTPAEDPTALAEAVRKMMAMSAEERRAMGERGRAYLAQHHYLPRVAKRYLELAEEVLASKSRV